MSEEVVLAAGYAALLLVGAFVLEWLRLPGDVVFIVGGAVPALYIAYLGIRHTVKPVTVDETEAVLFTEIAEPAGVAPTRSEEATAARTT